MALTDRVQGILLRPRQEWPVIDTEPATTADLYRNYIAPLAAIGPIARIIGFSIFGVGVPVIGAVRIPLGTAVVQAVIAFALALVGTYVLAFVIDQLAPTFGGTRSSIQALKVAAYSSTAQWVAGIFGVFPPLAVLSLLGFYSLWLLYLGLPALMKAPQERALAYTGAVVVVAIVIAIVVGIVVGAFTSFAY
jgi:hypothetical protein